MNYRDIAAPCLRNGVALPHLASDLLHADIKQSLWAALQLGGSQHSFSAVAGRCMRQLKQQELPQSLEQGCLTFAVGPGNLLQPAHGGSYYCNPSRCAVSVSEHLQLLEGLVADIVKGLCMDQGFSRVLLAGSRRTLMLLCSTYAVAAVQ